MVSLFTVWMEHLFCFISCLLPTLDSRGVLARQRRGTSVRERSADRHLRGFAAQFCCPQREKKPLTARVVYFLDQHYQSHK